MAKWGEGDPRWIVEERPDATNVNNWHWTEKNADSWSISKINQLFKELEIYDPCIGKVIIDEVEKCEGEARANNRKAKLIFFYEWVITLKWSGTVKDNNTKVSGKVHIPNLSEEHVDMSDVDIEVSITTPGKEAEMLKEMMRKGLGAKICRKQLQSYVDSLKSEFSKGLILPNKSFIPPPKSSKITTLPSVSKELGKMDSLAINQKVEFADVNMEETFKCTGQEIYMAMTQKKLIQSFIGQEVVMNEDAKPGDHFKLLGGNIEGSFVEIIPYTKIVQKWRLKSWPNEHYSLVTINISQGEDDTKLTLLQSGVPRKELDRTKEGWRRYYWESIKRCFGYGQILF